MENRFVLPTYFARAEFGDLAEKPNRRRLAKKIVKSSWFPDLQLDPEWIAGRIVDEAWTVGAAIGLVLRAYSEQNGKLRWGDKRPYYRTTMWAIQRMFPEAQFIHVVRDGRDAVASMANVPPWDVDGFDARVRAWLEAAENAEQARENLPADTFHEVRYEKLVADPEKELTVLCGYLGERFDEAMLRPEDLADGLVPEHQPWHVRTRERVSSRSVGAFTERLEPWQLAVCETVMGDRLTEYGYELTGAGPAEPERLAQYAEFERQRRRRVRQIREEDEAIEYPWPVADMAVGEAKLHRRVARLEQRVEQLSRQRDDLRDRMRRLTGSRSWRWTAPLRRTYRTTVNRRPS